METAFLWTLIHSIWIGIIAAVLTGVIIWCTRRSSAKLRYLLYCGVLGLFVLSTIGIGWYAYRITAVAKPALLQGNLVAEGMPAVLSDLTGGAFQGFDLMVKLTVFVNQYALWMLALWTFFFCWKVTRLAGGIFYVQRLRKQAYAGRAEEWQEKLNLLVDKLGIKGKVRLLQSGKVNIPITVGFFRPVVLLPAGVLLQLPPAYMEAILFHELAHIRRHDYLVNLFQQLVETVFFFNPAVYWISQLIREEREACCDELVLVHVPKTDYLNALMAFQEVEAPHGKLAMALWSRNQFRNRFYRMMGMGNQLLSFREGLMLLAGMALLSVFGVLAHQKEKPARQSIKQVLVKTSSKIRVKSTWQDSRQAAKPISKVKGLVKVEPVKTAIVKEIKEMKETADTIDWIKYKSLKQQQVKKNQPFDNSAIAADVQKIKNVASILVGEGIVDDAAAIEWFGLSETELVVNGQKQPAALHEKLRLQTQVRQGHGLYYGPVKMSGQGFFLDKQDLAKL